jgi:hypothetical protein
MLRVLSFVIVAALLIGSLVLVRHGARLLDDMFVQPAVTQELAVKELSAEEPGWELYHSNCMRTRHLYIFRKGDLRRDVNFERGADGNWIADVEPITPSEEGVPW